MLIYLGLKVQKSNVNASRVSTKLSKSKRIGKTFYSVCGEHNEVCSDWYRRYWWVLRRFAG